MNAPLARVTVESINAQIAASRPVRPWHQCAEARRLIQSCVEQPPVWEAVWLKPAHRETRDEYCGTSSDVRVVMLERIRQAAVEAIVSQGQSPKAQREFDRWQADTVEAVIIAANPVAASVDHMHAIAAGERRSAARDAEKED